MKKTILLVEDNAKDEALTLRALKRAGITNEVTVARDGAEALDILFCTGAYIDRIAEPLPTVALVDLNLPKISGHEVVRRIRADARTKLLPVVILTSSNEDEDRAKGYEYGANSYVRKPVEFGAFAGAVQQLGLYWLALNETAPQPQE
jgi:two-component system, response regulator